MVYFTAIIVMVLGALWFLLKAAFYLATLAAIIAAVLYIDDKTGFKVWARHLKEIVSRYKNIESR